MTKQYLTRKGFIELVNNLVKEHGGYLGEPGDRNDSAVDIACAMEMYGINSYKDMNALCDIFIRPFCRDMFNFNELMDVLNDRVWEYAMTRWPVGLSCASYMINPHVWLKMARLDEIESNVIVQDHPNGFDKTDFIVKA